MSVQKQDQPLIPEETSSPSVPPVQKKDSGLKEEPSDSVKVPTQNDFPAKSLPEFIELVENNLVWVASQIEALESKPVILGLWTVIHEGRRQRDKILTAELNRLRSYETNDVFEESDPQGADSVGRASTQGAALLNPKSESAAAVMEEEKK